MSGPGRDGRLQKSCACCTDQKFVATIGYHSNSEIKRKRGGRHMYDSRELNASFVLANHECKHKDEKV